jgi:hypothetical protein
MSIYRFPRKIFDYQPKEEEEEEEREREREMRWKDQFAREMGTDLRV